MHHTRILSFAQVTSPGKSYNFLVSRRGTKSNNAVSAAVCLKVIRSFIHYVLSLHDFLPAPRAEELDAVDTYEEGLNCPPVLTGEETAEQ